MNTNVLPLLSRLKQLDITLELVEDNLKIHAPEGKLAPALISEIKDKKKEIVAFMQQAQKQVKYTSVIPVEKKEYYPPSSAQRRLYILQQMEPDNTTYNMPEVLLLEAEIDKEQLENTFKKLITRHESLRTSFAMPGETPIQKVCPPDELEFGIEYYDLEEVKVKAEDEEKEGTRGFAPSPGEPAARTPQPAAALINSFIRPFDLSQAPLLRVGVIVIRGESSHQLLLIDMHHIVTDGVSQELLKREFTLLHTGNPLLPLKVYYKDYSEWLNRPAVKKVLRQQGEFWLKEFGTDIPILNLPTDFARPLAQSYEGSSIKFELTPGESGTLLEMARSANTTIFILLMAIYYIFLSKLSGQEDIVVGTPTAGRRHPDLQQIIGIFINTLALRGSPAGNKSFTAFLGEVKEKILTALENQDYPFEDLVEAAAVERDMSRNPLFDVMFALEGALTHPEHTPDSPGEHSPIKPYDYENKTAKFDLTLYALETRDQLVFTFEYCTRLFKPETITIFIAYLQKIISEIIQNPQQQISGIQIISRQEREKILYGFNDTDAEFPREKTIQQLFAQQAGLTPDYIAVVGQVEGWKDRRVEDKKENVYLTYKELKEKSQALASRLQEKGVQADTIVGIMVERSLEMIVGIFGIVEAGGAYLPIDPQYPEERINYMIADSNAKFLVTTPGLSEKFKKLLIVNCRLLMVNEEPPGCPGFNNPPKEANPVNNYQLTIDNLQLEWTNLAYLIYTSGTTGKPKAVTIAHFSLVNRLHWMQKKYPLDKTDTILHKTPFTFDVSVWEIFWWAITGARVCLLVPGGEKEPEAIIDAIERNQVTTMHFVPSMLSVFLDYLKETRKTHQLSSLKQVIASGEALTISQVKRFHDLLYRENQTRLANLYGPTEAAIDVSYYDCLEKEEPSVIPIGKPIDNIRLYILDKYLHIQPTAIAGELYIAGVGLARGYLNRPELTAEKFVEYRSYRSNRTYIFKTGDLARWLSDGNIEFLGRIDHQVKIRGFRIELGEIESQILRYNQVKETVVMDRQAMGRGDDQEKYLCAYIVSENDLASFLPGLQEFLSRTLPYYMIPAYFVQVERIPLTPNGKVNRNALPEPETKTSEDYTAPRHEIEKKLSRIWQKVLALEKVGIKDNFYNIGGDSIRAIRVLSAVNTALNTQLRAVDLVVNATIEKLAERIKQYKTDVLHTQRQEVLKGIEELKTHILAENKLKGDIEDLYPMSDIEKGMVFYSLKNPGEAVYHDQFPYIITFHTFEPEVFQKAMILMVEKHQALRTGFDMDNFKEPVQVVYKSVEPDIRHEDISEMTPHRQKEYLTGYMVKDRENLFDVYSPPLWRMRTFGLGNKKICALWIFHHAIMDGWSVASLMTELNNTYLALKANPQHQVEKLKTSYKEFIVEQLIEKKKTENYTFWRNELEDYKRLSFPILLENEKGANVIKKYAHEIGLTVLEALNQVAKKNDTSIKHLCLAAYIYMLSIFSLRNDIVAGMVTDNRPIAQDGDKVVGCFLNTIPVRVVIPALITWDDYIRMVDKKMRELARYNRLSLYEIVRIIGEKTQQDNPIFDTLLNYTDFHVYGQAAREKITDKDKAAAQEGFAVEVYENTNTLLDFTVNTLYPDFSVYISYTDTLIRENGVAKLCIYFKRVLDKFIHEPHSLTRKVDILPPEDKQQLLYDFNDTKTAYSRDKTMHQLFEEQVEKTPDHTAVIFNGKWINYRELNRRTNQLAWELRKKGVLPDRFVGVVMDRTNEMVIGVMAILKAGGAYVPIEPYLPEARIITCLATVNAECLLTNRLQLKHISEICQKLPGIKNIFCLDLDELTAADSDTVPPGLLKGKTLILNSDTGKNPGENLPPAAQPGDIAYVIFTSGTTGLPKGVVEQHRPVVNIIQWVNKTSDVNSSDKLLFVASLSFDLSVYDIFGILAVGGSVRVVSREDIKSPERLLDIIFEEGITIWDSAPAALQQLVPYFEELKETRHYPQKSKFRLVLLSGDWIPLTMPDVLKEAFPGIRIVAMGGGTEATIWSNFYIVGEVSPYWRSIPYGKPTQNARYYALDQFLNPCPVGVPGDLYIGGECLAAGYINDPDLTAHKFIPNPYETREIIYRTGDMARWYADGNMEFLGRQDNQVKIRGFRIELGEIESQLLKHKEIKAAVVLARAGKTKSDQYLCAYYVSEKDLTTAQLTRHLSEVLPEYMIPPYFVRLEKMPVTANGKLDRKALPEPASGKEGDGIIPPRDELEKKLAAIWSEVLGIETGKIGINSNFFDLGGHSLNATIMAARLHKITEVRLPLVEVFTNPTIEALSKYIKGSVKEIFVAVSPVEKKVYYPLASAQNRLYILHQMDPGTTAYNIPEGILLEGELEKEKLEETFKKLIDRHESLRTSFVMKEGNPVQRVHNEVEFEIEYYDASSPISPAALINSFVRPFDLSRAPLLRTALIKTDPHKHIMMVDIHHIISDAVSHYILRENFMSLYYGIPLPLLKLQYKDYSQWQWSQWAQGTIKAHQDFWLREFEGEIPILNLPTDYQRPEIQSFEGHTLDFSLGKETTSALKKIAQEEGVTSFMLILTIFYILLSKISSQEDIVIGTDAAGRDHVDLEDIIGMFVNTLSLRNYPNPGKSFKAFLLEVRERTLRAFDNQDYPFEELVEQVSVQRDASRNPIFDILFSLVDIEAEAKVEKKKEPAAAHHTLIFEPYPFTNITSKFDLTLNATESPEHLFFSFEYCTKLFKEETIQRFITYFKNITALIISDRERKISGIEIISPAEKNQLLFEFNNTLRPVVRDKNYAQLFEVQAVQGPDKMAVVFKDRHLTYNELDKSANRIAHFVLEHGTKPGEAVGANAITALYLKRSPAMLASIIGVFKAAAAYVPIETDYPQTRVRYLLEDSQASILITDSPANTRTLREITASSPGKVILNLEDEREIKPPLTDYSQEPPPVIAGPQDLAYIIYTSGTTGKPKGVMIHQMGMINHLYAKINDLAITAGDIIAQTASACFDISVWQFLAALLTGGQTFIIDKEIVLEPRDFLRQLRQAGITILESVPSLMTAFLEIAAHENEKDKKLEQLRWMVPTGEPLTPRLVREWYRHYPAVKLINAYGPTEASDDVTHYPVRDIPPGTQTSIPIGKPLQNLHIYILDKYLSLCPVGIRGEICVAGIGVGKGYWQDPGKTAQSFIPNPYLEEIGNMDFATLYKTGDIGYFREDGTVECLGRLDDQVKIRGNRIELGEIEQQLLSHQEIKEAVVLAKVSEDNNKYLCAYLVGTQEAPTDTELREFLAGKLPAYMIPAYFVFIDKIPLTPNGKIDRKALPEPEAPVKEEKYEPPRNEKEQRLVEVWQKVLGLAKIGITDNFFEIGGDSINAIQVAAQLKQYQLELRINHLFLYPNIKELANWVTTAVREIPQDLVEGKVTLTPIQQWFFAGNFTDSHHYNLALMLYNPQGFPPALLEKLFTKIIEHHDALRMVYVYEKKANRVIQENRNLEGKLFDLEILSFEHTDSTNPELGKEIEKEATRIQASIDLEKGPLVKLGLFKTSAGDHLLIAIHHLVVDGISWRILLEDITTGYHQLLQGKDITFPAKTDSFKYWAEKLEEFAAGTPGSGGYNVLKELAFWENIQNTKIKPLPRDHHIGKEKKKHRYIQSISINLEEKETEMLLREVNWAYNTEINDILLTTLGLAIKEWSGNDKVLINLEGHGRENIIEPVDISRTVGWFTTEYPVILDMGKSQQLSYQVKYVKETLRSIPNKGIGYGILRYLTPAEKKPGVSMTLEPEIGFNYLGQFGSSQQSDKPPQNQEQVTTQSIQSIQMSPLAEGQSLGPDLEENYAININGMLIGKRLNISFSFNKYEYETQSIEKLCSAYKANLLQIIDHCTKKEKKESTPSDFDYSDLDLEELEELKNGLSQVV